MNPENFISKINKSLQTNRVEEDLLSHEARFLRSRYILKIIENVSKVLNIFDFKDNIIFEETVPYINLNGIKLKLNTAYFLKHSGKKFLSQSLKHLIGFSESTKFICINLVTNFNIGLVRTVLLLTIAL